MTEALRYVGIDVAKDWLDVAVHGRGQPWRVTPDEQGVEGLISTLREQGVQLVVLEATGGYEIPITAALGTAGIPVAVVNPRQVRDFARSLGKLAKPVPNQVREPTAWMPRCWPTLGRLSGQSLRHCRILKRESWLLWWLEGGSCCRCMLPNSSAASVPFPWCASALTGCWQSWSRSWGTWIRSCMTV